MAKKNLRAQMDAARAAAAFIGAAQEEAQGASQEDSAALEGAERIQEGATSREDVLDDFFVPQDEAPATEEEVSGEVSETTEVPKNRSCRNTLEVSSAGSEEIEVPPSRPSRKKTSSAEAPTVKPKATRGRPRKKKASAEPIPDDGGASSRMTAQVLVPMSAEQREHADLLAQVMKITRAEVMRQALDEYWDNHKSELQAAVAAYEELIRKLMS